MCRNSIVYCTEGDRKLLSELEKKLKERELTFINNDGEYSYTLSDESYEDENDVHITVIQDRKGLDLSESSSKINLCTIPVPSADNIFVDGETPSRLINGLISRDGFYIYCKKPERAVQPILQFFKRDEIFFKFQFRDSVDKRGIEKGKVLHLSINDSFFLDIYHVLLALCCVKDVTDFNNQFKDYSDVMYMYGSPKLNTEEEIANILLSKIFSINKSINPVKELHHRVFDNFFDTSKIGWQNKHVFFSFARFIGFKIKNYDGSGSETIITPQLAKQLDDNKSLTVATIEIDGVDEKFYPDRSEKFGPSTLINVIRLFALFYKHSDRYNIAEKNCIRQCDKNAIWNLKLYMMYDYMADYVIMMMQNASYTPFKYKDKKFFDYIKEKCDKVKETVSVPNCISYAALKYTFTRDVFKKADSYTDRDKLVHKSYQGWISPPVTSDSKKVGLTGCFDANVINNNVLCRKYNVRQQDGTYKSEYLETYQTYNKIICVHDRVQKKAFYLLNGQIIDDSSNVELEFNSDNWYDLFTGGIVGKRSNQGKRHILGYKAVNQCMPAVYSDLIKPPLVQSSLSGRISGKTVRQVLDEISNRSVTGERIYKEDSVIRVSRCSDTPLDTRRGQKTKGMAEQYIHIDVDGIGYEYKTLRYITATTQHVRLKYRLLPPQGENETYRLDDEFISCGDFQKVGQEINVMFGNFDGSTYEDAVAVTTDFVNRMGFAIKPFFHQDIEVKNGIAEVKGITPGFDKKGLPIVGTFICKGSPIARVCEYSQDKTTIKNPRIIRSEYSGYVEEVKCMPDAENPVEIRVYLSDIRCLRLGDKTGNGHGNKGVIMRIIDSSDLVVNGKNVDMILNPLGTIGRMNIGQLKEMLATSICESKGVSLSFKDIGTDSKTIEELTNELKASGNYSEHEVIYKGERVKEKFFISKLHVYRTEHISTSKLNYTERESLDMQGNVKNGQRMSELNGLTYAAYGAQEVINYLIAYQSNTTDNYNQIRKAVLSNYKDWTIDDEIVNSVEYVAVLRAMAYEKAIGLNHSKDNISFLLDKDITFVPTIHLNSSLQSRELAAFNGETKFDVDDPRGYLVNQIIDVGHPVIMPIVLEAISEIIPFRKLEYTLNLNDSDQDSPYVVKDFKDEVIRFNLTSASRDKSKVLLSDMYRFKFAYVADDAPKILYTEQEYVANSDDWESGYFGLVEAISNLKLNELIPFCDNQKVLQLCKSYLNNYGETFFSDICLRGIPVLPINLRPTFGENQRAAQEYNNMYRVLLNANSVDTVVTQLSAITANIKNKLTAHQGVKALPRQGVVAQSEKSSIYRDTLFARIFSNSSRSVAGYSFDLPIDHISLPYELAIGMVRSILIERASDALLEQLKRQDTFEADTFDRGEEKSKISETINAKFSGISYNKDYWEIIVKTLKSIYDGLCVTMTREPVLQKQNTYAYKVLFNDTDCILVNPSVCNGYNLDFDGDQEGIQLILDRDIANKAFELMSPYNGMFYLDDSKSPFRPFQDILFGIYRMTKFKRVDTIKKIYATDSYTGFSKPYLHNAFPEQLRDMLNDLTSGNIQLSDTVMYVVSENGTEWCITETVGNIMYVSMILGRDTFLKENVKCIERLLNILHSDSGTGLTSKNSHTLIPIIVQNAKEICYSNTENKNKFVPLTYKDLKYTDDEQWRLSPYLLCDTRTHGHIPRVLMSIERMNRGSIWLYTVQGVGLSPDNLSSIPTLKPDTEEKETLSIEEDMLTKFRSAISDNTFLFKLYHSGLSDNDVSVIRESLMNNEFFGDLIRSGARGKLSDFLQMYGVIGEIPYNGEIMNIKGNYNTGLGLYDDFIMSAPVRASNVNAQNHLGIDGSKLREMSVLASGLQLTGKNHCKCDPNRFELYYDYYLDDKLLREIKEIDVTNDDRLRELSFKLLMYAENPRKGRDKGQIEYGYRFSGALIDNIVNAYNIDTINGIPLVKRLSKFSEDFVKGHYVVWKGKEVQGLDCIDDIRSEKPQDIEVYSIYSCTDPNGICNRCYGVINDELQQLGFQGNIGINTIWAIGKEGFQNKLDSAKNSKDKKEKKVTVLDLFNTGYIKSYNPIYEANNLTIVREDFDVFRVNKQGAPGNSIFNKKYSGAEMDMGYLLEFERQDINAAFIPDSFIDFRFANKQDHNLERIYMRFLKGLYGSLSIKQSEVILATVSRFMIRGDDIYIVDTSDSGDSEDSENMTQILGPEYKPSLRSCKWRRIWCTKNEAISNSDPVTVLCLPGVYKNILKQARERKKYNRKSIFYNRLPFGECQRLIDKSPEDMLKNLDNELAREEGTYDITALFNHLDAEVPDTIAEQTIEFSEPEPEFTADEMPFDFDTLIAQTNEF